MDFQDRRDAGRRLGRHLAEHDGIDDPVVFGLARGGVPVAADVAAALAAPLDVLVVRKVGAPGNPEYALGAVAEDDVTILDQSTVERVGAADEIDDIVAHERREVEQRVERYRSGRPPTPVEGRTAVIVDDGIATGRSAIAAVRAVRTRKPARVLVAAPVGAPQSVAALAEEADDVVCLDTPEAFFAVGAYYRDFGQTSDDEVAALLAEAHERPDDDTGGDPGTREAPPVERRDVDVDAIWAQLPGYLWTPRAARGVVVFAHGSGSSRDSPRNQHVAERLNDAGFATLLFDLLTSREGRERRNVFDIGLLTPRLVAAARWCHDEPGLDGLPVGLFGASTGAAAALDAAAELGDLVGAVVSRGGRPDLSRRLAEVDAPVLLIVGSRDRQVLDLNRAAAADLRVEHEVEVVEGATHLFEEPGTLDQAADAAARWFAAHL